MVRPNVLVLVLASVLGIGCHSSPDASSAAHADHASEPVLPQPEVRNQIVFVIDCSRAMQALVTDEQVFDPAEYPDRSRMEIVKTELSREIERLEPPMMFDIISFATDVKPWRAELQPASVEMKRAANEWVKGLHASGEPSQQGGLGVGDRNVFDALRIALGVDQTRTSNESNRAAVKNSVIFTAGGLPTSGAYVDPEDVLREIKRLNDSQKITIHTLAIGEFDSGYMQRLSEENGPGVFVNLGH